MREYVGASEPSNQLGWAFLVKLSGSQIVQTGNHKRLNACSCCCSCPASRISLIRRGPVPRFAQQGYSTVCERFARGRDVGTMRYLPLVWAAFHRHTIESLLTFSGAGPSPSLFSARWVRSGQLTTTRLKSTAWTVCWSPRDFVAPRSASPAAPKLTAIPGVRGTVVLQGVFGFRQEPSMQVGVWAIDGSTMAAIPELRLTPEHWKRLQANWNGLFFTRSQAAKWKVKAGDAFPVKTFDNHPRGQGRSLVLHMCWGSSMIRQTRSTGCRTSTPTMTTSTRISPVVSAATPSSSWRLTNRATRPPSVARSMQVTQTPRTPTYCVPLQTDARNMVDSVISMRQMSVGIAQRVCS